MRTLLILSLLSLSGCAATWQAPPHPTSVWNPVEAPRPGYDCWIYSAQPNFSRLSQFNQGVVCLPH
jgi:hypothetical protein